MWHFLASLTSQCWHTLKLHLSSSSTPPPTYHLVSLNAHKTQNWSLYFSYIHFWHHQQALSWQDSPSKSTMLPTVISTPPYPPPHGISLPFSIGSHKAHWRLKTVQCIITYILTPSTSAFLVSFPSNSLKLPLSFRIHFITAAD